MGKRLKDTGRWYNNVNMLFDSRYADSIAIHPYPGHPDYVYRRRGFALCRRVDDGRWHLYCWAQQPYSWPTLREAMRVSLMMCKMGVFDEISADNPQLK